MNTRSARRAFTILELLIVVGIIAILVGITFVVGVRVTGTGKTRQTEAALKVLDASVTEFVATNADKNPRPWVVDPRPANSNGRVLQPVIDGRNEADGSIINSVGLYMAQCRDMPSVMPIFKSLDAKLVREFDGDASGNETSFDQQAPLQSVMDGWGNPVRYVHPKFFGTVHASGNPEDYINVDDASVLGAAPPDATGNRQWGIQRVRRSVTPTTRDADGGSSQGKRPYFYSAGPDGDPSTTEDNVYIAIPDFSKS